MTNMFARTRKANALPLSYARERAAGLEPATLGSDNRCGPARHEITVKLCGGERVVVNR